MSHELEMINGVASMAYSGNVPWHGLGKKVLPDLTPEQMLYEAQLDWSVEKVPAFAVVNGENVSVGKSALVRSSDSKVLDVVGDDWNPVQNAEAFGFFADFVSEGNMEMHTAGSLKGGQMVWALAKVKDESFELFGKDRVDSYLLFSNPHQYGKSIGIRFTPTRVVCNNTLTLSLGQDAKNGVTVSHRTQFNAAAVKQTMGIAYLERLFPVLGEAKRKQRSKAASAVLDLLDTQPGAEMGAGTFWQLYNGATYYVDHKMGRTDDNRMSNAWFGSGVKIKTDALILAVEMAG
jgi:hypothetical protein